MTLHSALRYYTHIHTHTHTYTHTHTHTHTHTCHFLTSHTTAHAQWAGGRVMQLGWTSSEDLIVIVEDGSMAVYGINGQLRYSRVITRVS